MKRWKILLLLTLVLLLAAAGYFGARLLARRAEADTEDAALDPLWTVQSTINRISYTYEGEQLTLELSGDTWHCTLDPEAELDSSILADMVRQLQQVTPVRVLDTEERALYGLDVPVLSVSFLTEGGEQHALSFGDTNAQTGDIYLEAGDDDCVYTASVELFQAFACDFLSLIQKDTMPAVEVSAFQSLEITRDSLHLELCCDTEGKATAYSDSFCWFIGAPYDDWTAADTENAKDLFYNVSRIYLYDCAYYAPDEATWAACGLTAPMASVTMTYTDDAGETQTALLEIGDESPDGRTYVRINHGNMILTANTVQCQTIAYASANALLPTAICLLTEDMVDSMTLDRDDTLTLFSIDHAEDEPVCKMAGHPYDSAAMADFFYRLQEITQAESDMDIQLSELGDPAATLTFHTNREGFPSLTLRLYDYQLDGEAHYAVSFAGRHDQIIECSEMDALLDRLLAGEIAEVGTDD